MDAAAASAESGSCPLRCTRFFTLLSSCSGNTCSGGNMNALPSVRRRHDASGGCLAGSLQHDRQRMFQKILKAGEELNGEQAVDKPMIDG